MIDYEREINKAEEEWSRAIIAADEAALEELLSDDAIVFHGSGIVEQKAPFITNLSRRLEIESVTRDKVQIRQLASTVVVTSCVLEQRVRPRGSDSPFNVGYANVSRVWVKRDDRWRVANYHATRLVE